MFSVDQLKIFFICLGVGVCAGTVRDLFSAFLYPFRGKKGEEKVWFCYEILFCVAFALAFIAIEANLGFPDFRGFMAVGLAVGFWLYYKIFRIMLAFLKKVCYNILKNKSKRKNSND